MDACFNCAYGVHALVLPIGSMVHAPVLYMGLMLKQYMGFHTIVVYYIGSLCSYGVHALLLSIGSMVRALVMHIVLCLSSAFVVLIIVHLGLILSGVVHITFML